MLATTVRDAQSQLIHGAPERVWSLLSSPAAWSLRPHTPFVFEVPGGAERLRFYIGPTIAGHSHRALGTVVYEVCDELPGEMIKLRTLPAGQLVLTLSVTPGRRGTAKASVAYSRVVPRSLELGAKFRMHDETKAWLIAVRDVIEGRAPWPGSEMPDDLRRACSVRPDLTETHATSAAVVIDASPGRVWDAVHSPHTARVLSPEPATYSGYVPGTPTGQEGEMQYFIRARTDGGMTGTVTVTTEIAQGSRVILHTIGPTHVEGQFLLTPEAESGPTRLELTWWWPVANPTPAQHDQLAESTRAQVTGFKTVIEEASASP